MPQASCENELFPITLADPLHHFWHDEFLWLCYATGASNNLPFPVAIYRVCKLVVIAAVPWDAQFGVPEQNLPTGIDSETQSFQNVPDSFLYFLGLFFCSSEPLNRV